MYTEQGRGMAQMTTPQELFEHELKDIYYAERVISQILLSHAPATTKIYTNTNSLSLHDALPS